RLNLEPIGVACKSNNILFCVDAIQSLGVFEMDVQKIHADYIMADGHKWLMSPEGLAIFYVSEHMREQLKLHQYGWHMVEALGDYDKQGWQPAHSARRFECGSPNMLGIHALYASLMLIHEISINKIQASVLSNTDYMLDFIRSSKNLELLYIYPAVYNSGIVTFRHKNIRNSEIYKFLTENKIICAIRGGGIRFSPHFYTPREKIRQALQFIEEFNAS
ncbi:MAG: aminotransferase class V-fold PLP-dependent enzyme, partial [Gammaproteobacteria bacterium]